MVTLAEREDGMIHDNIRCRKESQRIKFQSNSKSRGATREVSSNEQGCEQYCTVSFIKSAKQRERSFASIPTTVAWICVFIVTHLGRLQGDLQRSWPLVSPCFRPSRTPPCWSPQSTFVILSICSKTSLPTPTKDSVDTLHLTLKALKVLAKALFCH